MAEKDQNDESKRDADSSPDRGSSSPHLTGRDALEAAASGRRVEMTPEQEATAELIGAAWDLLDSASAIHPDVLAKMGYNSLYDPARGESYSYKEGVDDGGEYKRELTHTRIYKPASREDTVRLIATTAKDTPADVKFELIEAETGLVYDKGINEGRGVMGRSQDRHVWSTSSPVTNKYWPPNILGHTEYELSAAGINTLNERLSQLGTDMQQQADHVRQEMERTRPKSLLEKTRSLLPRRRREISKK